MAKSNQELEDAMQLYYDMANTASHKQNVKHGRATFHTQHSVQCMKGTARCPQTDINTRMHTDVPTVNTITK